MSNYNYQNKINHRNELLSNININSSNPNNMNILEWYQTYMPFLPKEVLNVIPILQKEKQIIKQQEENLEFIKYLFK